MRLARVLLGVEHLVTNTALVEQPREQLALFNTYCSDKDRLPGLVFALNIVDHGREFCCFSLENKIWLICTNHFTVRRDRHNGKVVRVHQFGSLSLRSSRHSRKLFVHPEIVLQRHRCQCLIFFLDLDAFFCLNCLVDAFAPATTLEDAACELIDNHYFTILNDVVLIAVIQHGCLQSNL